MAYIYKAVLYSNSNVKIPKRIVSNKDVKQIIETAIKSVKYAKKVY